MSAFRSETVAMSDRLRELARTLGTTLRWRPPGGPPPTGAVPAR